MRHTRLILSFSLLLAVTACTSSTSKTPAEQPTSASTSIVAKSGGTVTAGSAALDIPAGSLTGDV
jgi:outer membrane biogenesis lipoprotein LolB